MAIKVGVIFGGQSDEHEVSIASAANIIRVLNTMHYEVVSFGISKFENKWYVGKGSLGALAGKADKTLLPKSEGGFSERGRREYRVYSQFPCELNTVDIMFPVIHGKTGEDGVIQAIGRIFNKPIIGCDILSSALCFNKHMTKVICSKHRIPITDYLLITIQEYNTSYNRLFQKVIRKFQNKPIFVKPNKSGSSWGISKVIDYNNELEQAIKNALTFDNEILIEYYIEHREIVMGVIHYNGEILISLPGECGSVGTIYDYNEKYILGNTLWKCPAQINMKQKQKLAFYAKKVFNILCCKDFARVDFFLDKNSDKIILNEVNTIPGFTESSVFPKLLSASGYSIEQLISYWIEANLAAPNCKE